MRSGTKLALLALVGASAAAGLAIAQGGGSSSRKMPVVHEDLPPPNGDKVSPLIGATTGSAGAPPAAFTAGDKVIPRPTEKSAAKSKNDPVLGTNQFAADRATSMKPDTNTGPDGTLHYVSVFNPDVIPFKRMSSLDGAGEDFTLRIAHPAMTEVPVGGVTAKGRDRFWAAVKIQLTPGADVPLPSVAPDMRILWYRVKPNIALTFEKDGADNFYVRTNESSASGVYDLQFLADADSGYFTPQLPRGAKYTPAMIAAMTPPELRPVLPDAVRKSGLRMLDKFGIDAGMDLSVAFNKLVGYFRAFEAKKLPSSTGNIYEDLCDSQAGVCRHRAFAFMISANVLGIPTRYVQNEAHAFVEVWFPERRWQRIDLGGAALRMEVTGADDKTLHRPAADDPFTKPPEYSQSYTQLEGDIRGLTQQQLADKKRPLDQAPPSSSFDGTNPNSGSGAGSGDATARQTGPDRITPDPTLPTVSLDPKKLTPKLEVTTADSSAFRGDVVHIEGRVTADGKPIADHPIDVFLAPAGRGGASPIPLGRTVSDKTGAFRQEFTLPGSLNLATYEIYLASPEDSYYNASLSN
ncbi:MAG: transglutaminase family protein [Kofleriaceae bacterium]